VLLLVVCELEAAAALLYWGVNRGETTWRAAFRVAGCGWKYAKATAGKLRLWITQVSKAPLPEHSRRTWNTAKKAAERADFPEVEV
jgi:hypothetical protein